MNRFNYCRLLYFLLTFASLAACKLINNDPEKTFSKKKSAKEEQKNIRHTPALKAATPQVTAPQKPAVGGLPSQNRPNSPRPTPVHRSNRRESQNRTNITIEEETAIDDINARQTRRHVDHERRKVSESSIQNVVTLIVDNNNFKIAKQDNGKRALLKNGEVVQEKGINRKIHYKAGSMSFVIDKNGDMVMNHGRKRHHNNQVRITTGNGTVIKNMTISQKTTRGGKSIKIKNKNFPFNHKNEKNSESNTQNFGTITANSNNFSVKDVNGKRVLLKNGTEVAAEDKNGEIRYWTDSISFVIDKNGNLTSTAINQSRSKKDI